MNDKPYRVISPVGMPWAAHFKNEEAAWSRILSANGSLSDTPENRVALSKAGWVVRTVEPALYGTGGDDFL